MLLPKVWPENSKIDVSGYYQQGDGLTIDAMHSTMVKSLKDFRGSTPSLDDTALLSCRFR